VSGARRYLAATALLAVLAGGAGTLVPERWRLGWWLALGVTLVLQGPLGWWLVASLGTERFLGIWAAGIFLRLLVVGLMGLVVVPALGLPAAPVLLTLVGFLVASLVVEAVVSVLQSSRVEVR
jgi:hypothetical protein